MLLFVRGHFIGPREDIGPFLRGCEHRLDVSAREVLLTLAAKILTIGKPEGYGCFSFGTLRAAKRYALLHVWLQLFGFVGQGLFAAVQPHEFVSPIKPFLAKGMSFCWLVESIPIEEVVEFVQSRLDGIEFLLR